MEIKKQFKIIKYNCDFNSFAETITLLQNIRDVISNKKEPIKSKITVIFNDKTYSVQEKNNKLATDFVNYMTKEIYDNKSKNNFIINFNVRIDGEDEQEVYKNLKRNLRNLEYFLIILKNFYVK